MRYLGLVVVLMSVPFKAMAANSCSYELFAPIDAPPTPAQGLLAINSDVVSAKKDKELTFTGRVRANHQGQLIRTERISYYPDANFMDMAGSTDLQGTDIHVSAPRINLDSQYKILNAEDLRYLMPATRVNGKAESIYRVSDVYTRLNRSSYSTCPVKQEIKDWHLASNRIILDHAEGIGSIKNAKLKIKNVAVLYLPRFTFPLDERRKSGFLIPYLRYKNLSGLEAYAPWYWNIAPHMDALIIPGILSKRGFWLGTQFRYLNQNFISRINVEGLYQDQVLNNENRYYFGVNLRSHPGGKLAYGIDYSKLSDDDYISDFKQSNFDDNTDYVNQRAFIQYQGTNWSLKAEAQAFQSLVDNSEKYRLLPRITFSWNPPVNKYVSFGLSHQYSKFDHPDDTKAVGERFNNGISLGLDFTANAYFVRPGIHVQNTSYRDLENFSAQSADRTATSYFIDGGIFLEREFANNNWLQTLEPRIFYVKRAREDESDLPNFDTSLYSFSYNRLFSHKLYSGKDFTGELDRISLGLVSKFIRLKNNSTHLEFKLGQGYNFNTKEKTNMAFETYINHNAWRGSIKNYFYPEDFKLETQETSIHYQPSNKLHLKTSYKFKDTVRKEIDLAGAWQINSNWLVYGRSRHSLLSGEKRAIENLLGFEYDSCCWAINLSFKRELITAGNAEYDNSVNLSIELKGLTGKRNTKETLQTIFE